MSKAIFQQLTVPLSYEVILKEVLPCENLSGVS